MENDRAFVFFVGVMLGTMIGIILGGALEMSIAISDYDGIIPIRESGSIPGRMDKTVLGSEDRKFEAISLDDGKTWFEVVREGETRTIKSADPEVVRFVRFRRGK